VSVVKLLGGLGGEVLEVLVWTLGVEPVDPVQSADLDVLDVAPRTLAADKLFLNEPTVVSARALS
jgi:hypothetical protein